MATAPTILFLYTAGFPYGDGESFLWNELSVLSQNFQKIFIIPAKKQSGTNRLPENAEVLFADDIPGSFGKKKLFLSNFFLVCVQLLRELRACRSLSFFISRFRLTLSELLNGLILSKKIEELTGRQSLPVIHYSFWMNEFPLALSVLKQKKKIERYVFRVHGYDLYEERWPQGYIPFRARNYRYSSAVVTVSKMGLAYIKQHYSYAERARYSYLGTLEQGLNPFSAEKFTLVTCSMIIPLKRLDLLARALLLLDFPVNWFHFGSGKEEDEQALKAIVNTFGPNISVKFAGHVSQDGLFDFYRNVPVMLFVNVSETEGLPVSVIEAISVGIPVLATDVGGTSEAVNDKTGWLVPKTITEEALAVKLRDIKNQATKNENFRKTAKAFWKENFYAEKNYNRFCSEILIPDKTI